MGSDLKVHLSERAGPGLRDKVTQAYMWIVNNAILCPYYDIEFGEKHKPLKSRSGDELHLHGEMSYSSFVLIPLLTLLTCRRALMIGGPGRGKTTSAILMSLLAGIPRDEMRRAIQRGHPQLTIADLLGSPLPADMLKAEDVSQIKVAWRQWIEKRVKIVDEYNRIPTKTQSALLSLMAEGYAEMFDQYVYAGRSSWFLTANDDAGGGTFQVIAALQDRIDVVVRAVPFNSAFLGTLLARLEADKTPEELVPSEIVLTPEELAQIYEEILAVAVPEDVLARLGYFFGQLEFCRMASPQFEYMNKDTLHLSGRKVASVCDERCPLDKKVHLCTRTENGVSVRAYQTALHFAKAVAWVRGHDSVELEDLRQMVPWVLHEKLTPNARSPFFEAKGNESLLHDRVVWIRDMFDAAMARFARHAPTRTRVTNLRLQLDAGLVGLPLKTVQERRGQVAGLLKELIETNELSGPIYEDLIHLKSMYSRYQNQEIWLRETPSGS